MRRFSCLCYLLLLPGLGWAKGLTLEVNIVALKSDTGQVVASLFSDADAFPTKPERALAQKTGNISAKRATIVFENLSPGDYAIAAYHDEDRDNTLDSNFLGIPQEGVASSKNAKGNFGPPKFADAKMTLKKDKSIQININY